MSSATGSARVRKNSPLKELAKCPTGIRGLDEITLGGLPKGRPTLVCGGAGCGKTLLGMEFLVRGATEFGEPGVCLSFEETGEELAQNVASLGFDVPSLIAEKKILIDYVFLDRSLIEEAGEYDLEALFVRLDHAVKSIGAKRVVFDSIEALFAGLKDEGVLRAELRRIFGWLKDHGLTAIITCEKGDGKFSRHGLEEYVSDCVISLDHEVTEFVFTRRLRVVKYRGSLHGTNEYPFLIDRDGISVLPITSLELNHGVSNEQVSTGIPALDQMLGGKGFFRGSSALISGTAGTGKSSISAQFVAAGCARGERCAIFSFEESEAQFVRNMKSIGIDLGHWIQKGLLQFHGNRPTAYGLEMHLVKMHKIVNEFQPTLVAVDPITGLLHSGSPQATRAMLLRMIDFLKEKQITVLLSTLTPGANPQEYTEVEISSLVDTWILLRDIESEGERNRGLHVLKARGLAHSNQVREFLITSQGLNLREVYMGSGGLMTGTARVVAEAKDASVRLVAELELANRQALAARRQKAILAQIDALRFELESEEQQAKLLEAEEEMKQLRLLQDQQKLTSSRRLHVEQTEASKNRAEKPAGGRK